MVNPWYTTREAVKASLDSKETARNNSQVDRCIEAASRAVEGALHRKFYPLTDTKSFPWPQPGNTTSSYRLWLENNDLSSVTTLTSGGVAITSDDYYLEPQFDGPPYDQIQLDLSSTSGWTSGDSWQRSIVVTGVWAGAEVSELLIGTVVEALDSSETGIDVNGAVSALVGVGSVIRVDDERMIVTGRTQLDTGVNLAGNLAASVSVVTVPVGDGTAFAVGEVVLIDSERMLILDIAGNNLTVKRSWDGTVLATHTNGADVYAPRSLAVQRGSLGTTAAAHDTADNVYLWKVPALIEELTLAYTLTMLGQQQSGYALTIGSGENERESGGRGLEQIKKEARAVHGRMARVSAV